MMRYVFPAPQLDACAERQAWRFQRCGWCGWTGDIKTMTEISIRRHGGGPVIDGVQYKRGLVEYLYANEDCPDNGLDEGVIVP